MPTRSTRARSRTRPTTGRPAASGLSGPTSDRADIIVVTTKSPSRVASLEGLWFLSRRCVVGAVRTDRRRDRADRFLLEAIVDVGAEGLERGDGGEGILPFASR